MNALPPSLPSFKELPFDIACDCFVGYLYGKLFKVNPNLTTAIFAIRSLCHTLFYQIAFLVLKRDEIFSHKIYIATTTTVNLTFIIALRQLNLIGTFLSYLLSLGLIGHLISRICYIQREQDQLFEKA